MEQPKITTDPDSGKHAVTVPGKPGSESRVTVNPGSAMHPVLASATKSPMPDEFEDEHASEVPEAERHPKRRRANSTTTVTVQQPPSGGLTGRAATYANLSAVALIMVLVIMMYRDFTSTVRERDSIIREEMKLGRETDTQNVRMMSNAIDGLKSQMSALALSNSAMAAEFRASRLSMEARFDKVIGAAKQPHD